MTVTVFLRANQSTPLTWSQVDTNFTALANGVNANATAIGNAVQSVTGTGNISASPTTGNVTVSFTGTLPVPSGGTGVGTLAANNILLGNGAAAVTTVASTGTSGQVLTSNGSGLAPTWTSLSAGGSVASVSAGDATVTITPTTGAVTVKLAIPVTVPSGGTGVTTLTQYGVVYGGGAGALTATAAGTAGQPLMSGGGLGTPPAFGTLGVSGGGTGSTSLTAHGVVIGNGTGAFASTATGASGQPLISGGTSLDPAYGTLGVVGGGTGNATLTQYGVLIGNGTSAVATVLGLGSAGQVLASNGPGAAPTWQAAAAGSVSSVTNSDGSITVSPTSGAVVLTGANTYTRTETSSLSRTFKQRVQALPINLMDFYVTGTTTDDTALTNALASCATSGRTLYIPRGFGSSGNVTGAYVMTTANKTWKCFSHSVICEQGVTFDLTSISTPGSYVDPTNGTIGTVLPNFFIKARDSYNLANTETQHYWHGGRLYFSSTSTTRAGVSGFWVGDDYGSTSQGAAGIEFKYVDMQYPDVGFLCGNNCYLGTFKKCVFEGTRTVSFYVPKGKTGTPRVNSGENFRLWDCLHGDAAGMFIDVAAADVYVHNASVDFSNGVAIARGQSWIRFVESHIEWSNNTSTFLFNADSGDSSTGNVIMANNCTFSHDTGTQSGFLFHGSAFGSVIVTKSSMGEGGSYTAGTSYADSNFCTIDLVVGNGQPFGMVAGTRIPVGPTVAGSTTGGTITYTDQSGYVWFEGGFCHFNQHVSWSAIGTGAGNLNITLNSGSNNSNSVYDALITVAMSGIAITSGNTVVARVLKSSQIVNIFQITPAGVVTPLAIPATGSVYLTGFYPVNS